MNMTDEKLAEAINCDSIHIDELERFCLLESKPRGYQNLDDSDIIIPDFPRDLRAARREINDFVPPVG
ncbi:hypothetical protein [Gimesia maris]|jgi:hypothetical protein|uniref:Uncharacterized protein n=1 Tax=Gimesia maris TaxID=122 RepID=A0A3D3RHW4_9PLAN|nr:hypothetical protein [Gimesia maris]MAC53225.1 hypothetical protein [Gimesia sp.]HAW28277.1 hypothetical protein [Planctomycetaceae bacterium]EDL61812.1 tryptophan synthase subunit beta [Gimesia maris DSM 8797]QDT77232.1 hypothetical protein Mal35_06580 [Gimesia maris]QDU12872.1 hypothetical protein CA11_06530 [Gimesia maris]|tara:strand:- start:74430 stop:74633 length:204 start_codon:yes stop_codon:yes gene_type:complete